MDNEEYEDEGVTLSQVLLGFTPYVLLRMEGDELAISAGGRDATPAVILAMLRSARGTVAKQYRRRVREARRSAKR